MRYFKTIIERNSEGPVIEYHKFDEEGRVLEAATIFSSGEVDFRGSPENFLSIDILDLNHHIGEWEMSGVRGVNSECSETEYHTISKLIRSVNETSS
jgi:hypothetical protein